MYQQVVRGKEEGVGLGMVYFITHKIKITKEVTLSLVAFPYFLL
jgi:hypothetical protein